ncbi:MAG: hypothetical protein IT177_08900 [Acidobacteria bacterium]|nr:hypothetical protein [Acidobacteriota bacterium]
MLTTAVAVAQPQLTNLRTSRTSRTSRTPEPQNPRTPEPQNPRTSEPQNPRTPEPQNRHHPHPFCINMGEGTRRSAPRVPERGRHETPRAGSCSAGRPRGRVRFGFLPDLAVAHPAHRIHSDRGCSRRDGRGHRRRVPRGDDLHGCGGRPRRPRAVHERPDGRAAPFREHCEPLREPRPDRARQPVDPCHRAALRHLPRGVRCRRGGRAGEHRDLRPLSRARPADGRAASVREQSRGIAPQPPAGVPEVCHLGCRRLEPALRAGEALRVGPSGRPFG